MPVHSPSGRRIIAEVNYPPKVFTITHISPTLTRITPAIESPSIDNLLFLLAQQTTREVWANAAAIKDSQVTELLFGAL